MSLRNQIENRREKYLNPSIVIISILSLLYGKNLDNLATDLILQREATPRIFIAPTSFERNPWSHPPSVGTRFQSSRRRNWFRWQVAWAQSARELSENYTLTGQSELPTTILSTDPIQQNHSNLKGNRLLVGGTKGLIRNSFLCPLYRRNGLAPGIGKRKYEKSRVHHARSSLCRDCKVSRGKLEPPTVSTLANYLLGNTSMKAKYRAKSFYFVVELSFLSFFFDPCGKRGSVDDFLWNLNPWVESIPRSLFQKSLHRRKHTLRAFL